MHFTQVPSASCGWCSDKKFTVAPFSVGNGAGQPALRAAYKPIDIPRAILEHRPVQVRQADQLRPELFFELMLFSGNPGQPYTNTTSCGRLNQVHTPV